MEGLEDLSKICRLCLQGGEVMCPIFSSSSYYNGAATLSYRIMSCAKVKLVEGDGLPSNVCTSCLAQVDRSYQFKLLCEKSELTLRGFVKSDDGSSETESLDGSEPWDMTKFTPEVIIKEETDEGILVENGLSPAGNQTDSYLPHTHIYPHHLYPLQQVEELLRNHGTEIKIQVDQNQDSSNVTCANPNVPVALGHPTTLLVTHRLVPVMSHQQRGITSGVSTTATAVLLTTNTPPTSSAGLLQQSQQKKLLDQSQQSELLVQQKSQQKVSLLTAGVPVATSQQQNGGVYENNHLQQQQELLQQKKQQHQDELLPPQGTLEPNTLSSKSRRCRGGDKLFKCSQCNKSYSFSSALSRHKAVHNKELRPHICKICNKGFTHSDKLLRHQKTHSIDVFMNCDVCNKPFKSYPSYQKHKQSGSCEGISVKNSVGNWCDSCNTELNPEKIHNCKISDNNSTTSDISTQVTTPVANSPSNSANREHPLEDDEEPPEGSSSPTLPNSRRTKGKSDFKCKVCLKYFATKGSLEVHSTIHTGVRPFVCSACGKSFRHKVNLMEHFQRKHSQVRPYICDVCAARFVTKQELVRHYRKHIGD